MKFPWNTKRTDDDWEAEVPTVRMSNIFAVLLVLHIVAIGGLLAFRIFGKDGPAPQKNGWVDESPPTASQNATENQPLPTRFASPHATKDQVHANRAILQAQFALEQISPSYPNTYKFPEIINYTTPTLYEFKGALDAEIYIREEKFYDPQQPPPSIGIAQKYAATISANAENYDLMAEQIKGFCSRINPPFAGEPIYNKFPQLSEPRSTTDELYAMAGAAEAEIALRLERERQQLPDPTTQNVLPSGAKPQMGKYTERYVKEIREAGAEQIKTQR